MKVKADKKLKVTLFSKPISTIGRLVLAEAGNKPITLIVLVCGMVVTYWQYQAFLDNGKVEKSFDIVEEWETRNYQQDLITFSASIRFLEEEALKELGTEADIRGGPVLTYIQRKLTAPDTEMKETIGRLYYFFDKLSLCVEQDLCDRDLLIDYFGSAARSFWIYTLAYQSEIQTRSPDFGKLTQRFSELSSAR